MYIHQPLLVVLGYRHVAVSPARSRYSLFENNVFTTILCMQDPVLNLTKYAYSIDALRAIPTVSHRLGVTTYVAVALLA